MSFRRISPRSLCLIAAIALLLVMPLAPAGALLALFVAADLGAAALMLRDGARQPATVTPVGGDATTVALLRRTTPALRMRHPATTVEAQARWRQEAERRRRGREAS